MPFCSSFFVQRFDFQFSNNCLLFLLSAKPNKEAHLLSLLTPQQSLADGHQSTLWK
jgi:hypothetical protein